MQAQAVINKLRREATNLRATLIEEETKNYVPSPDSVKLAKLLDARDETKKVADKAADDVKKFSEDLNLTGIYGYTGKDEVLKKLRDKEISKKYPAVDVDAALDDLIIESVEEDFDVNKFIEHYLDKLRNNG